MTPSRGEVATEIQLDRPDQMNLLGLFMKAALESRVPAIERARPRGDIALSTPQMSVTLSFSPDRVIVRKGVVGKPRAQLRGSLESLLQVARGRTARPLLTRRARLSGNPLAALPLARVFKHGAAARPPAPDPGGGTDGR